MSGFSATSPAEERELGPSVCELNVFHVRPGQWGTGLATALMTATINWMHEAMDTQTELGKPLWRDLEIPQVRYVTDRIGSRP